MPPNFERIVLLGAALVVLLRVHRVSTMDCGTVYFVRPAIFGGTQTFKGEWPFVAAIYNQSEYICGGTVISCRHILTAAHCIQKKNSETTLLPHEIVVRLGAYNLTKVQDTGVIQRNVSAIFVHPDWDTFSSSFDADIAILILGENITFTNRIQPVCMPGNGVPENMVGSVVGYGVRRSRGINAEIPRRAIVHTVNSSHCYRDDDALRIHSSERTFCGGYGDGSPNLGDSGSGYFYTSGFYWTQYGIVSALRSNETGHVISHSYHVYTNVTKFKDWIVETVNLTGGVVGEAKMNFIMNCDYMIDNLFFPDIYLVYSCMLRNVDIQGGNFEVSSVVTVHSQSPVYRPDEVKGIHFVDGTMFYLPSGFGLVFENVEYLTIGHPFPNVTLATKAVRRSDLQNLRQLSGVRFYKNDIDTLHEDALWDLPELRTFTFIDNKLKELYNETFSRNRMLAEVFLSYNELNFLPSNLFRYNPLLSKVNLKHNRLKIIDENFFKTNRRLNQVDLGYNRFNMLPKRLFQKKLFLNVVEFMGNNLSVIDEDLFETNRMLQLAVLAHNRIESLPSKLFRNNLRLIAIDLQNNSLATIDKDLFVNNRGMKILKLDENRLEHLHRNVFDSNPLLLGVTLSGNRLKSVDVNFVDLGEIQLIDLHRNDCINAGYHILVLKSRDNIFGNLTEFQNHVTANCSTGN